MEHVIPTVCFSSVTWTGLVPQQTFVLSPANWTCPNSVLCLPCIKLCGALHPVLWFLCIKLCGALHSVLWLRLHQALWSIASCPMHTSSAEHCSYLTLVDQCVHEGSVGETPRSPIREFPCPHLSSHLFIVSPLGLHNPSGHMQSY